MGTRDLSGGLLFRHQRPSCGLDLDERRDGCLSAGVRIDGYGGDLPAVSTGSPDGNFRRPGVRASCLAGFRRPKQPSRHRPREGTSLRLEQQFPLISTVLPRLMCGCPRFCKKVLNGFEHVIGCGHVSSTSANGMGRPCSWASTTAPLCTAPSTTTPSPAGCCG